MKAILKEITTMKDANDTIIEEIYVIHITEDNGVTKLKTLRTSLTSTDLALTNMEKRQLIKSRFPDAMVTESTVVVDEDITTV